MKYCDDNDAILEWSSEEIIIPYRSPVDGEYIDISPTFGLEHLMVKRPEIKPKIQTKPPKPSKNKKKISQRS